MKILTDELTDWIESKVEHIKGIGFGEITVQFLVHNSRVRVKKIIVEGENEEKPKNNT